MATLTPRDDQTLGQLVSRAGRDLSDLLRAEVELARIETVEEAKTSGRAAGVLVAGGLVGYLALLLLLLAAAWGLAEVMPTGVAFLIVGVVVAVVAAVLIQAGRRRLAQADPVPRQTVQTLEEDVQWARQQLR